MFDENVSNIGLTDPPDTPYYESAIHQALRTVA